MKVKVMNNIKKLAAITTGALFVGATLGIAGVFGSGLSTLPANLVHNGAVNAVVVVGANSQATDVLGSIDIASALTASAAASHVTSNGVVQLGVFSPIANATSFGHIGGSFNSWTPSSIALENVSYQSSSKLNYTAMENVTFLNHPPVFSGLNVIVPAGSLEMLSSVVNRSGGTHALITKWVSGLKYEVGTTLESYISNNSANYTLGVETTFSNFKVPSILPVGTHTVDLEGLATVGSSPSSEYYQLEYAVNNGPSSYTNISNVTVKNGGVILTFPAHELALTNSSGTFLSSLQVSGASTVQNWSDVNQFGLGAYNATHEITLPTGELGFVNTANETLNYSFSAASSFALPDSLKSIQLGSLTHDYHDAVNFTVTTGASAVDRFIPINKSVAFVAFNATDNLPNVAFGVNNRGTPSSSGAGAPNLLLEGNESLYNSSSGHYVNYSSEYIFPTPANGATTSWLSGSASPVSLGIQYRFANQTSSKSVVRLVYELPNGNDFALQFMNTSRFVNGTGPLGWNATQLLTYTASTTLNPTISVVNASHDHTVAMGGYNLTFYMHKGLVAFNLTGPVATVASSANTYSLVPGYAGLYSSTGKELTKTNVSSTDVLGQLSFSGSVITYTDPLGATQTVTITENKSNFVTNVSKSTLNTTANTWGDFVSKVTKTGALFVIPSQNYTVGLGASSAITSTVNYTAGDVFTTSAGKMKVESVGGSSVTAAGLFGAGVFPLAEADTSFTGTTNSVPVVVVGGPAVNTLAQTLYDSEYNVTSYGGGAQFTSKTGVAAGEALVQWFTNVSAFGKQNALWVAGYNPGDTLAASEAVAEFLLGTPVTGVTLNGTSVILSTSVVDAGLHS